MLIERGLLEFGARAQQMFDSLDCRRANSQQFSTAAIRLRTHVERRTLLTGGTGHWR